MVYITERIEQFAVDASMAFIHAGVAVKKGIMTYGEGPSRWMHSVYSCDGFEKWTKALIADLRLLSLLPSIGDVFKDCIKTLEAQKDLYYASLFIGATADDFMYEDSTTGEMRFKLPRYAAKRDPNLPGEKVDVTLPEKYHGSIDYVRLLYGIGHYFEVFKFLQKYKVFPFATASHLANTYGAVTVFNRRLDDIPVINTLFDKPKDFCIFVASSVGNWVELNKCLKAENVTFDNMLKFTSCTGKMFLIFLGKWYGKTWWFAVADVLTQNASLISLVRKRDDGYIKRFNEPWKV